jgi:hypothetical protein
MAKSRQLKLASIANYIPFIVCKMVSFDFDNESILASYNLDFSLEALNMVSKNINRF